MSRTERLLALLQLLRRHRTPVTGPALARDLGVSLRTLYRDIATLQGQGADIEGEAGVGYVMRPGFTLPPLMFTADEIEALVLGMRWVSRRADDARLGDAAGHALSKITAVLPPDLRDSVEQATLLMPAGEVIPAAVDLGAIRVAIRQEKKLSIAYRTGEGDDSVRLIWPFALAFFEKTRVITAWCELRGDFRSFRVDRIAAMKVMPERYPSRRAVLLKRWREREGISPGAI